MTTVIVYFVKFGCSINPLQKQSVNIVHKINAEGGRRIDYKAGSHHKINAEGGRRIDDKVGSHHKINAMGGRQIDDKAGSHHKIMTGHFINFLPVRAASLRKKGLAVLEW